jgi:hypothetical protein
MVALLLFLSRGLAVLLTAPGAGLRDPATGA